MNYGDFIICVDESGDHGLKSIDQGYPVFVLDFCLFRKDVYVTEIAPKIQAFKFKYFGHDNVILHEREIHKQRPPFAFLKSEEVRQQFMGDLNRIVEESEFTIIAAAIDKRDLIQQYACPANPYSLALAFCMERSFLFLRDIDQHTRVTHVVVERRGKREDDELGKAFQSICNGANWTGSRMPGFEIVFADKKTNSAGLQLADLTARPIGLQVIKPAQSNRAWDRIKPKLRRSPQGDIEGWGLKVFP